MNPELRQTLNTISRNFESANEVAQENIYTFTQAVIDPCVTGFKNCIGDCTTSCFPKRDDRLRRRRARSRGRSDLHFDFYDDWEEEDDGAYTAGSWGNDELDSLLAGRGLARQPGRQTTMSYGTSNRRPAHAASEENTNIIPSSSYLGFLERFKWRPGAKGMRYKPSAADLQEHPGGTALARDEAEPLIEDSENDETFANGIKRHKRQRSDTQASGSTTNSLSSRGDLIMSDEEEDAQPLDEEFAFILSRQNTNSSKRPGLSMKSARTVSSRSSKSIGSKRSSSNKSLRPSAASPILERSEIEPPSMAVLKAEEEHLRREQEMEIEQKREMAVHLARNRGLNSAIIQPGESVEVKTPDHEPESNVKPALELNAGHKTLVRTPAAETGQRLRVASSRSSTTGYNEDSETEPFPSFPTTPTQEERDFDPPP